MAVRQGASNMQLAPITGNNAGVARAEVKQGVRSIVLCKDANGKFGLRVQAVSKVRNKAEKYYKNRIYFYA